MYELIVQHSSVPHVSALPDNLHGQLFPQVRDLQEQLLVVDHTPQEMIVLTDLRVVRLRGT